MSARGFAIVYDQQETTELFEWKVEEFVSLWFLPPNAICIIMSQPASFRVGSLERFVGEGILRSLLGL